MTNEQIHAKILEIVPKFMRKFLDPKDGVTSSQANHVAEKIKEINRMAMSDIDGAVSASEEMMFEGRKTILKTAREVDFETILPEVGLLNGLTACFREGIKGKEAAEFINEII